MTIKERVMHCVENLDCEQDNIEKLVALAYFIGKEEATKNVSDAYTELIKGQIKRAVNCRYNCMAMEVVGKTDHIYFSDYSGDMTGMFGSDETNI